MSSLVWSDTETQELLSVSRNTLVHFFLSRRISKTDLNTYTDDEVKVEYIEK